VPEVRIRLSRWRKIAQFFSGTIPGLQPLKGNLVVCRQTIPKVSAGRRAGCKFLPDKKIRLSPTGRKESDGYIFYKG
jgi:hypothetical protein